MIESTGSKRCDFRRAQSGGCQFQAAGDLRYFRLEEKAYCQFHAPLEAIAAEGDGKKRDFDIEVFNRAVVDRIKRFAADNPNYDLRYNATTLMGRQIIGYLKERLSPGEVLTDFYGTIFPGPFSFEGLKLEDSSFARCQFHGDVMFDNCTFSNRAIFDSAEFFSTAWFWQSRFLGIANFRGCVFHGNTKFGNTTFEGEATYYGAHFKDLVHWCTLAGPTTGEPPRRYIAKLDLTGCRFDRMACFRNRDFEHLCIKGAVFADAPALAGATVGDDTVFQVAEFSKSDPENAPRYAVLRRLALGVGDIIAAERFRALTFACQSKDPALPQFSRLLIKGYRLGSVYGTNAARAALALLYLTSGFFVFYWFLAELFPSEGTDAPSGAAWFTLRQIVRPFDVAAPVDIAKAHGLFEAPTCALATLACVQSIVTIVVLGLFLQSIYRIFNKD